MTSAYLTALGKFLPGEPVSNRWRSEDYLGRIHGKRSRARLRILKQNGIESRHYAIDKDQRSLYSNSELAALAVKDALARAGAAVESVDFLSAATSQGDFPLPGFASYVQADLGMPPCEIASHHGICVSGVAALKHAALQVESRSARSAPSRACRASLRAACSSPPVMRRRRGIVEHGLSFDAEFLRWMLSDGGGAAVVEPEPGRGKLALKVEWIELRSLREPLCALHVRGAPGKWNAEWVEAWRRGSNYASYQAAADDGAINLRQDIRMLDDVVKYAVDGALRLVEEGRLQSARGIDWLVAHYSSNMFLDQSRDLAVRGGIDVPCERWFSNLRTKGNIGSASIYVLLRGVAERRPAGSRPEYLLRSAGERDDSSSSTCCCGWWRARTLHPRAS